MGLALNVNFPDEPAGAVFCPSQIGTYSDYRPGFTEDMAASATPEMKERAKAHGMDVPALPGLLFAPNSAQPTAAQMNDEAVLYRTCIAVSPMQAGYGFTHGAVDWFGGFFATLDVTP